MELSSPGDSRVLIIRLCAADDGTWIVDVGGATTVERRLAPATLIIQIWRPIDTALLRGTIQLAGSGRRVAFQSNTQLLELLQDWLPSEGGTGDQ